MRSMILSLMLGLGVLGFSLATPTQAKADDHRGPAFASNSDTQLVHWRGGWGWGGYGRSYYPGWGGYGYYRGFGYPYGGWSGGYYPRYYGGYYPWGYGARSYYYRPGFWW
jgi:hypothetical protein